MLRLILRAALMIAAFGMFSGCTEEPAWRTHDIAGLVPDLSFTLTDDTGHKVNAQDYRGKVTLLYFAYTHCPDVCPTTLAQLAAVLRSTNAVDDTLVLVVTVDPARDSTAIMHEYVRAFGPQFVGLRGERSALDALARRYRVTYSFGTPDAKGDYEVTHSTAIFVFDANGRGRLLFSATNTPDAITADLRRLIAESHRSNAVAANR